LQQFPGLVFTPHVLLHVGDQVAVHFTEHGASPKDGGHQAAWPSIGIYTVRDGLLAHCHIEQDYMSRRRQLQSGRPDPVERPAMAPWDTQEQTHDPCAVRRWLAEPDITCTPGVVFDDAAVTGEVQRIIDAEAVEILLIVAGGGHAAFHAVQHGRLAGDFALELSLAPGTRAFLHLSGLVSVRDGEVIGGRVLRDRLGLYRRLAG
jgi:hypothetical protein